MIKLTDAIVILKGVTLGIFLALGLAIVNPVEAYFGPSVGCVSKPCGGNDNPSQSESAAYYPAPTTQRTSSDSSRVGSANTTYMNSSASKSKSSSELQKMIKDLQKRVEALTKQIQNKNTQAGLSWTKDSSSATSAQVTKNLGVGSKGVQVTSLQQCLASLGYFKKADMDPTYGPKTRQAVKQFQAAEGIASSGNEWSTGYGYVGPQTRKQLNSKCGASASTSLGDAWKKSVGDAGRSSSDRGLVGEGRDGLWSGNSALDKIKDSLHGSDETEKKLIIDCRGTGSWMGECE